MAETFFDSGLRLGPSEGYVSQNIDALSKLVKRDLRGNAHSTLYSAQGFSLRNLGTAWRRTGREIEDPNHRSSVDGAANDMVIRVLKEMTGIPQSRIQMIRGTSSRSKDIFFEGFTIADIATRLGFTGPRKG